MNDWLYGWMNGYIKINKKWLNDWLYGWIHSQLHRVALIVELIVVYIIG